MKAFIKHHTPGITNNFHLNYANILTFKTQLFYNVYSILECDIFTISQACISILLLKIQGNQTTSLIMITLHSLPLQKNSGVQKILEQNLSPKNSIQFHLFFKTQYVMRFVCHLHL